MCQGSSTAVSCGVDCRWGLDPTLLWLWHRPATVAPTQPLAWEPSYAAGPTLKSQKKKIPAIPFIQHIFIEHFRVGDIIVKNDTGFPIRDVEFH